MTDKIKSFWTQNAAAIIITILNIVFFAGMYFAILRKDIEAKPDEKRVREIVREEIVNKFSITDGEVLKTRFDALEKSFEEVKQLIHQYMEEERKNKK